MSGQAAKLKPSVRSGAQGSPASSHGSEVRVVGGGGRNGRKRVRHIKEWPMKHAASGWLSGCAKVQHIPNFSHTQVRVMICDQAHDTEKNVRATRCSVFRCLISGEVGHLCHVPSFPAKAETGASQISQRSSLAPVLTCSHDGTWTFNHLSFFFHFPLAVLPVLRVPHRR